MAKLLPNFEYMVMFYPGDGKTAADVKQEIGGDVNKPEIDDTCIVRISKPLNIAGHLIPPWTEKFRTRQGKDKRWYGLRVKEFWPYMITVYGKPVVHAQGFIDKSLFRKSRGIIGFKVPFADGSASGHFTLWNGKNLLYGEKDHDYFSISTEAALWSAPTVLPFFD
ncbi:MAG: hypothetical protein IPM21_00940 [Acidobacteria bacterium]|nr:hypothetical protein [Acidobacteriota bacterium]